MRVFAVVLAAGSGQRLGRDKVVAQLGGRPLWRWSFDVLRDHPRVHGVGILGSSSNIDQIKEHSEGAVFVELGGAARQHSSAIACSLVPPDFDVVLIHDAARPFLAPGVINRVLNGIGMMGAAAPGLRPHDTLRIEGDMDYELIDRGRTWLMQTPQGAKREILVEAHRVADREYTDEMELIRGSGRGFSVVQGDEMNFKVTTPADLARAEAIVGQVETRTGFGYDIHAFSKDPARPLHLLGLHFPGEAGLEGHSDADAPLHALVDALLGAAGMGDIGRHFPPSDQRWKNEPSETFVRHAVQLLAKDDWSVVNVDLTVIAEGPRVMPREGEIRARIAGMLGIEPERVNIKATTNEGLGALGRAEGLAATAVATIRR